LYKVKKLFLSHGRGLRQLPDGFVPANWWQSKANRGLLLQEEGRLVMDK